MTVVYVLIVVAAAVALYLLLNRKPAPQLKEPDEASKRALPKPGSKARPEDARHPSAKAKAEKAAPEKKKAPEPKAEKKAAEASDREVSPEPAEAAAPAESDRAAKPAAKVAPAPDETDIPVDMGDSEPPGPALGDKPSPEAMRRGLAKSRGEGGFFGKLRALFSGKREIEPGIAEEIEEVLLASDVGVKTTEAILDRVREGLSKGDFTDASRVWEALRAEATRILSCEGAAGGFELRHKPTVMLMVGVNGCGKTTSIGKLATRLESNGVKCVLAAGDTFRAAAVQQLVVWGKRVGCEVVKGKEGADPGSVIFDSIKKAQEIGARVVLADTAGRLHTKANLMNEMKKIAKTAGKALDGAPHETLLVIDATTGQNALTQAIEFKEALPLTGIVLTKLDGTAKGGVILGISDTLGLPVRFVGLGERPDDLYEFSPAAFVEALLGKESDASAA